jgi:hypothetical protein
MIAVGGHAQQGGTVNVNADDLASVFDQTIRDCPPHATSCSGYHCDAFHGCPP